MSQLFSIFLIPKKIGLVAIMIPSTQKRDSFVATGLVLIQTGKEKLFSLTNNSKPGKGYGSGISHPDVKLTAILEAWIVW